MRDFNGVTLSEGDNVMFVLESRLSRGMILGFQVDDGIEVASIVDAIGQTHQKSSHQIEAVEGKPWFSMVSPVETTPVDSTVAKWPIGTAK
jgi:hypothetical protein